MSYYNIISGVKKDCSAWLKDESGYLASLELGTIIEQSKTYRSKLFNHSLNDLFLVFEKINVCFCNNGNLQNKIINLVEKKLKITNLKAKLIIDNILKLFNRDYLKSFINADFKNADCLENGLLEHGYTIKYESVKPVFHFLEEIDFVNIIKAFICGILSKSVNFFFVSEEMFELFCAVFELFTNNCENSDFAMCNSIICWCFPKEKLFETLGYAEITYNLHINGEKNDWSSSMRFWSDERVLKRIYGINFAIIDGSEVNEFSVGEIAERLVEDIVYTTEKPLRTIYVVDKDIKSSHLLLESLYDEMTESAIEMLLNSASFEDKCKIRFMRENARFAQALGDGRLECPADFSFNLMLEYNPEFHYVTQGVTVIIKYVQSLEELKTSLSECEINFGCASLRGFKEVKNKIQCMLLEIGIYHILNLGCISKMPTMVFDGRHSVKSFMKEIISQAET